MFYSPAKERWLAVMQDGEVDQININQKQSNKNLSGLQKASFCNPPPERQKEGKYGNLSVLQKASFCNPPPARQKGGKVGEPLRQKFTFLPPPLGRGGKLRIS